MAQNANTYHVRYAEVFNNLGVLEISAGSTAVVLSTIAIGVAPQYFVVPIIGWQASLLIIGIGILGITMRDDSSPQKSMLNAGGGVVGIIDMVVSCIVSVVLAVRYLNEATTAAAAGTSLNTTNTAYKQLKDGVLAIYIMNALIFFLGGSVLIIHAIYAVRGRFC